MKTYEDYGIKGVPAGRSGNVYVKCPQCSHTRKNKSHPCLSVHLEKQVWNCHHGCGFTGSLKNGIDKDWKDYATQKTWMRPDPIHVPDKLPTMLVKFFTERGISEETVRHFKVGQATRYNFHVQDYEKHITFPYFRGEELVNHKYRCPHKEFVMDTGAELIFYNLNAIEDETIIVEGEPDVLACYEAGIKPVISVPNGAAKKKNKDQIGQLIYIDNCLEELERISKFIIAVDNDEAGKMLEEELLRRLGRERCRIVKWPDGCKDANDVLIAHGKDVLKWHIDNAAYAEPADIACAEEITEKLFELYDKGMPGGYSIGFPCMNDLYSVCSGETTIVTGIPGSGKSEWLDQVLVNQSMEYGIRHLFFSPENSPVELHVAKLIMKYIGKPFKAGKHERMTREEVKRGSEWVHQHFKFISLKENTPKLDYILSIAKQLVFQWGVKNVIIDPWNDIDPSRTEFVREDDWLGMQLTKVRNLARWNQVHVFIVAHPTKLSKGSNGAYIVPDVYDISGGAMWANKADNVISVYRWKENPEKPIEIHIKKIRFPRTGKIGQGLIEYNPVTGKYRDFLPPSL